MIHGPAIHPKWLFVTICSLCLLDKQQTKLEKLQRAACMPTVYGCWLKCSQQAEECFLCRFDIFCVDDKLFQKSKTACVDGKLLSGVFKLWTWPPSPSCLSQSLLCLFLFSFSFNFSLCFALTFISSSPSTACDSDPPFAFPSHPSLCVTLQGKAPLTSAS